MRTASATIPLCISHPCRIRLREVRVFARPAFERRERARRVDVDDRVELLRQPRAEVMARALGLGLVHDADRPLEARRGEGVVCLGGADGEALEPGVVEEALD